MRTPAPQDLLDAYCDGGLTRRQFVAGALGLGFSVTASAGLLAACHSPRRAAPKRLTGRVQILVGFDGGNTAAERQVQQALAQAFITAHPQVGIDFLRATSAPAAAAQLRTLLARASPPDIVLGVGLADISRFADQHTWRDLRPLLQRDGISTGAFATAAVSASALPSYYGSTKAVPGIPLGIHTHALAYNAELFSRAGAPAPPVSWTDNDWALTGAFLQTARTLTVDSSGKAAGQPGFDPTMVTRYGVGRIRPESVFYSFGGHRYNSARRQAEFASPAALQGAQYAADLINKFHAHPSPGAVAQLGGTAGKGDDEQAAWRAGKLAMIEMCSCEIDSQFGSQVPFAWKVAALPAGPARRLGVLDVSLGSIAAASPQPDLAWEVLKFFAVDPANERTLAVTGFGAIPALRSNVGAFATATKQIPGVDPAVWLAGLPSASAENDTWMPAFDEVDRLFTAALAKITGGASAATVMPQLQQQAQARIDAWFKTNKLP